VSEVGEDPFEVSVLEESFQVLVSKESEKLLIKRYLLKKQSVFQTKMFS
jgi:hypothetical protein